MNLIRRVLRWLITRNDVDPVVVDERESERKAHVANLPPQPDLTHDPQTDVPAPHPGKVQHVDLTGPIDRATKQLPSHLADVAPSDWDLLSPDEKALFEQITPRDESKVVAYPAPTEPTTQEWVSAQLAKAGYSEEYHRRFLAWRRVGVGMSMRYLNELKRRADRRDETLSVHQLIALRSRGIS